MNTKKLLITAGVILSVILAGNIAYFSLSPITLNFYTHPDKAGTIAKSITVYQQNHPRVKVNMIELPDNTDEKLEIISSSLALKDGSVDIIDSDVIWPSIFVKAGLVEDLSKYYSDTELNQHLFSALNASTINGKLYGIPYRNDAGMLYYRKDLLKKYNLPVPRTWSELIAESKLIQSKEAGVSGFGGSWKKFEGLTCNFFEFLWSGDGNLYDNYGNLQVDQKHLVSSFTMMQDMIYNDKIVSKDVLNYTSGDLRKAFSSGKLVFMRDWPTGYKAVTGKDSKVIDNVGVAPLPVFEFGTENKGSFGGWVYMVSKYSKNKKASIDFIKYMTSKDVQIQNAQIFNYLPTIKSLYSDPAVVKEIPYLSAMTNYFEHAAPRPRKSNYDLVSYYIQNAVHSMLSNEITPEDAAKELTGNLTRLK